MSEKLLKLAQKFERKLALAQAIPMQQTTAPQTLTIQDVKNNLTRLFIEAQKKNNTFYAPDTAAAIFNQLSLNGNKLTGSISPEVIPFVQSYCAQYKLTCNLTPLAQNQSQQHGRDPQTGHWR